MRDTIYLLFDILISLSPQASGYIDNRVSKKSHTAVLFYELTYEKISKRALKGFSDINCSSYKRMC